jgi:hypothetical protein
LGAEVVPRQIGCAGGIACHRALRSQPIYKLWPCFTGLGDYPSALNQPARGSDPCRSLILNNIYKSAGPKRTGPCQIGHCMCRLTALDVDFHCASQRCGTSENQNPPMISGAGKYLAHHRRSPPMRRSKAHASLDRSANLRMCLWQKEKYIWLNDCV